MKKKVKKLNLNRETISLLTAVSGGAPDYLTYPDSWQPGCQENQDWTAQDVSSCH